MKARAEFLDAPAVFGQNVDMLPASISHTRIAVPIAARWLGLALALSSMVGPARSANVEIEVFGHRLAYKAGLDTGEAGPTLTFGRTISLNDPVVAIEKIDRIGETEIIVGSAGAGGNACNAAPFIISVRKGEDPKLFGPLDSCRATVIDYDRNGLTIREDGVVGDRLQTWTWTPESGLVRKESVKAPDPAKGWTTLWDRKVSHPADLLESAEITGDLARLVGRDFGDYRTQMSGLGSARYQGDFLIGSACVKLDCGETGAFTGLDLQTRSAYAAFKPYGKRIAVHPPVGQWPETLREALREWARDWK